MILNKKEKIVNRCKTYKNSEIVKKLHNLVFENNLFFLSFSWVTFKWVSFFFFFFLHDRKKLEQTTYARIFQESGSRCPPGPLLAPPLYIQIYFYLPLLKVLNPNCAHCRYECRQHKSLSEGWWWVHIVGVRMCFGVIFYY